jgi:hypothetical protein
MNTGSPIILSERFHEAIRRLDEENSRDPNREIVDGVAWPREVVYARWLSEWVLKLCPEASEALRLAARSQHLCRWMIPRQSYPPTRAGYLQWREEMKHFHARKTGELLAEVGYPPGTIERVQQLNLKEGFPRDPESRVLEDALCLVFLEHQLEAMAGRISGEKLVHALRKTWHKMTLTGQAAALKLHYGPREKICLEQALSGGPTDSA